MEILVSAFIALGVLFILAGSVGVLRFPDVYTRLHSCGLIGTVGMGSIAVSVFIFFLKEGLLSAKALLFLALLLLTSPVSTHLIGRASLKITPLWDKSIINEMEKKDDLDNR